MNITFYEPDHPDGRIPISDPNQPYGSDLVLTVVELDPIKIDACLRQRCHFKYVGPGGQGVNPVRRDRVAKLFSVPAPRIEMPMMYAPLFDCVENFKASVDVEDGRHRLYALSQISGLSKVSVVVPLFQKALFLEVLG